MILEYSSGVKVLLSTCQLRSFRFDVHVTPMLSLHILLSVLLDFIGFLAHLAKDNVSFCHHLASVVRCLLTFHILIFSSETRPVYYYVFAVFTTLFYSKLRPTFEPDYFTLEQTSFFQNSFVPQNP